MKKQYVILYKYSILLCVPGIIALGSLLFLTQNRIVLIPVLLYFAAVFFVFRQMRRDYEKELEQVSEIIQTMLDGEVVNHFSATTEKISSKIQHQLSRMAAKLEGYDQMLAEDRNGIRMLITEIAHQLRTPLVNIETYLDLLSQSEPLTQEQTNFLEAITLSEQKLAFLIQSFIKMSRFENHLIQIRKESDDFPETVRSAIFQLHQKAESKDINITFQHSDEHSTKHDRNWLGEAIYNVLENSVKYSPRHSNIQLSLTQNEMFTMLSIRDYGIGIQKGEENQIFKRFYRGAAVTTEEGFGIGLYLSREIVLRHNGFMKVKREHPGLTMYIYLPQ
jgi:signal transduction histidine kinase